MIAATHIDFRDVMPPGQHPMGGTDQSDFDGLAANVDEDDLESTNVGIEHHAQIVFPKGVVSTAKS